MHSSTVNILKNVHNFHDFFVMIYVTKQVLPGKEKMSSIHGTGNRPKAYIFLNCLFVYITLGLNIQFRGAQSDFCDQRSRPYLLRRASAIAHHHTPKMV